MIGRLVRWPWQLLGRRRAKPTAAAELDARLAALERAISIKLEAQLVTVTRALAEVIRTELGRERRAAARLAPTPPDGTRRAYLLTRPASVVTLPIPERNPPAKESKR